MSSERPSFIGNDCNYAWLSFLSYNGMQTHQQYAGNNGQSESPSNRHLISMIYNEKEAVPAAVFNSNL